MRLEDPKKVAIEVSKLLLSLAEKDGSVENCLKMRDKFEGVNSCVFSVLPAKSARKS